MKLGREHRGIFFVPQKEARKMTQIEGEMFQRSHGHPICFSNGSQKLLLHILYDQMVGEGRNRSNLLRSSNILQEEVQLVRKTLREKAWKV